MQYKREKLKVNPDYEIDTNGTVYGKKGIALHQCYVGRYLVVCISTKKRGTKNYYIHRLMAEQFLPKPDETCNTIMHKNGITTDNNIDNLEWCSKRICLANTRAKFTAPRRKRAVVATKGDETLEFKSITEAARVLVNKGINLQPSSICNALKGRVKTAGGYTWVYKEYDMRNLLSGTIGIDHIEDEA